jgi:hypothetical protein
MEEGFLLHRVHVDGAGVAVNQGIIDAFAVLPDSTFPPLTLQDLTIPGTELALHLAFGLDLLEGGSIRAAETLLDFLGGGGLRPPGERQEEGQSSEAAPDKGPATKALGARGQPPGLINATAFHTRVLSWRKSTSPLSESDRPAPGFLKRLRAGMRRL